jgi:hypothetical protein
MIRMILGVLAGFIAWLIAWVGSEKIVSAVWPAFGAHQAAFQNALTEGGEFSANPTMLVTHIVLASIVSIIAGALAALVGGRSSRAPLIVGFLLFGLGLLKAIMSWPLVPIWYHVGFAVVLFPMALLGGRLVSSK